MARRTRKNKQHNGKKTKRHHTRSVGRKKIALLGSDADLQQVIAKLNNVITLCCHRRSHSVPPTIATPPQKA